MANPRARAVVSCHPHSELARRSSRRMEVDYRNKHILAPMVRVGTLPFRLLAADYGADITYGEEIIDHKMLKCVRRENDLLGTTDFVEKGTNDVVFRTCPEEKSRVVFQMGTSNAVRALTVAQMLHEDVMAIDINMGCPRSFSLSGGMVADRPRYPAQWSEIAAVADALSIPVIANGDVFEYEDFGRIKQATGAASVMVARGAMWNASVFSAAGKSSWEQVKREYVRKCILWDNDIKSSKHTLKEMIVHHSCFEFPEGRAVIKCSSNADLARLYGEEEYYKTVTEYRRETTR
ncbi:aldolase-type TIM barrel family protein isoform X4 [Wolffia australiana]